MGILSINRVTIRIYSTGKMT